MKAGKGPLGERQNGGKLEGCSIAKRVNRSERYNP